MARTIVIMRHGQAQGFASSDQMRALTEEGVNQVKASALQLAGIQFDSIWASPYLRAQQSADAVLATLQLDKQIKIDHSGITPDGDATLIGEELLASEGNILLASHMPFVSYLTQYLTGNLRSFATADCAVISIDDDSKSLRWVHAHGS